VSADLYVGLISGTSVDGIDAVLVAFGDRSVELLAAETLPYPDALSAELKAAIRDPHSLGLDELGALDAGVGRAFADAVVTLLDEAGHAAEDIEAVGSHGQTLRHQPDATPPFTLQVGDPTQIVAQTRIPTVADFRRQDLALGGQGAPLVPPFHDWLFGEEGVVTIVANIGGIANITVLGGDGLLAGFDTGPGNTLMDGWVRQHSGAPFDRDGDWATTGAVNRELLDALLGDEYFARAAPKSTGFERFNLEWLAGLMPDGLATEDVMATLLELTAVSLSEAVTAGAAAEKLYVCGGGAHNKALMRRLDELLPAVEVRTTDSRGLGPDWVEAAAFAWLARERLAGRAGNRPAVTGASRPIPLGALYLP
jgi:anhydro-N-acetylmuramic acid kinase